MTVYPFQIHFGAFVVTGYGLMMMVAFLVAGWAFAREVARAGFDTTVAWDTVVFAVIGGLLGGKIYFALLVGRWDALLSRGGLVWYGGFAGGAALVLTWQWWKRLPILRLLDLIAPSLALGYSLGRVGCFLVGDDYGVPTSLPWGMAFPRGAPPTTAQALRDQFHVALPPGTTPTDVLAVHPTQLYEVALAFGLFWFLWRIRAHRHRPPWLFGVYLTLAGAARALVETVRAKDDRLLGAFSLAQLVSILLIGIGLVLILRFRSRPAEGAPA